MAVETERKFLVNHEAWEAQSKGQGMYMRQGYLASENELTIRLRLSADKAFLTLKGQTTGLSRPEYEYAIPREEAEELFAYTHTQLEKTRYLILHEGNTWEVDVFHGENEGLIMAELELENESDSFSLPPWVSEEVTGDPRYFNSRLAEVPYGTW